MRRGDLDAQRPARRGVIDDEQPIRRCYSPRALLPGWMREVQVLRGCPAFRIEAGNEGLVDQSSASWNHVANWLRQVDQLQQTA